MMAVACVDMNTMVASILTVSRQTTADDTQTHKSGDRTALECRGLRLVKDQSQTGIYEV